MDAVLQLSCNDFIADRRLLPSLLEILDKGAGLAEAKTDSLVSLLLPLLHNDRIHVSVLEAVLRSVGRLLFKVTNLWSLLIYHYVWIS